MFYLKHKTIKDIKVGDRIMVLSDFPDVPAGTRGKIVENYGAGVVVEWQGSKYSQPLPNGEFRQLIDGFGEDELEYLVFETSVHPKLIK